MAQQHHRLNARTVETIKTPGRHADGGNLYLNVTASGARSWVFMFTRDGRQREMGLGPLRDVSLAKARVIAAQHRQALLDGVNPLSAREAVVVVVKPTFGAFADKLITTKESQWRNAKHRAQWRSTLATYAAKIAAKPVDSITTADVLACLTPIWMPKPETAARVRGRIEAVLNAAKAEGLRTGDNPAAWRGHLDHLLPKRSKLSRGHHAALPIDDTPAFIGRLRELDAMSARALEFIVLTATRTGEALGATWAEIDLASATWTIPAARMKAGVEHRVPLSDRAIANLNALAAVRTGDHVFPGAKRNAALSNMALLMTLRRLGVAVTTHGFRSTFRDWASERTNFQSDVCEMALAHTIPNRVEAAYRRGDLFEKRRLLMAAWAAFCEPAAEDTVVLLHEPAEMVDA